MGKSAFLDALKRAMPGLPPATQAKTLAYYEQRFVDGMALGRSEDDIARELGDPSRIAMTLRASVMEPQLEPKSRPKIAPTLAPKPAPVRHPASGLRVLASAIALGFFNLFMIAPAAVVGALLLCVYAAALTFYVGGIAITASGLAGANDLVLGAPLRAFGVDANNRTRIIISDSGIEVGEEKTPDAADGGDPSPGPEESSRVVRGAEEFAGHGLHISTDVDDSSRTTQTVLGLGMVLGGIAMFLLGLVAGRYTMLGLKRYLQMNLSLLRGA
jgi:uncharacterized membrane protein